MENKVSAEIVKSVQDICVDIQEKVDSLVGEQCKELDNCISRISRNIARNDYLPDADLEYYIVKLPEILYWASDTLSTLDLRCSVSRIKQKEHYNQIYMSTEGTQGVKQSVADMNTTEEKIVGQIYDTAYNQLRSRVDLGTEILQSLKKIITKRMADFDTSGKVVNDYGNYRRGNAKT